MRQRRNRALIVLATILAITALALLFSPGSDAGKTVYYVDDDGGQDFETIQAALNASERGDFIYVYAGVYRENVNVTGTMAYTLIGNGSLETFIRGWGTGPVVNLSVEGGNISGFTIRGGKGWPNAGVRVTRDKCQLRDLNCTDNHFGVLVESSRDTVVENCELSGNSIGCQLIEGSNNTIRFNDCSNQTRGISLEGGRENWVENNSCLNNIEDGILLWADSDRNLLANNSCQGSGSAIRLSDSHQNTLRNNICRDSYHGIYLHQSEEATLEGNIMTGCGVFIFGERKDMWSSHDMDETNSVNGRPLHYEHGWMSRAPGSDHSWAGQLIVTDCHSVEDWTIDGGNFNNGTVGVLVAFNTGLTLRNINCDNNSRYGVGIFHDPVTLENVSCYGNQNHGVYLEGAYNSELRNVSSQGNYYGLTLYDSDNVTLENCRLTDNHGDGLFLRESDNCEVSDTIFSRNKYGIRLTSDSTDTYLRDCTITNNSRYGLEARGAGEGGVDAKENWWGSDSGPYHSSKNPDGEGDNVTGEASLYPWTGAEPYQRPEATIDSINPNSVLEGEEVSFTGHGKGSCAIVAFAWYSDLDDELYNGSKGNFSTDELSNGTHDIEFQVQDECGNWSERVEASLKVNGIPRITNVSVSPTLAQEGEEVAFTSQVDEDGSNLRYVWFLKGSEIYNGSNDDFEISTLPNGSHTVTLRVQDDDGVWSQPETVELRVNGIPRAQIISVSPSDGYENDTFTFEAEGTDDDTIVQYLWSSSLDGNFTGQNTDNFTQLGLSSGDHSITLKVRDNHGVWSEEAAVELTVKETPPPSNKLPTLTITSPANGSVVNETVTLTGTSFDQDGTVEKVELSINGSAWVELEETTVWSYSWNTTTLENGSHHLRFRAFDGEDHSNITVWELVVANENKTDDGGNGGDGTNGEDPDPDDDDDEEGIPWHLVLLGVILGVVVAMLIAWKKTLKT